MKLNMKKKGFTIVELVIVIAVIAVLAAVLIPTFINLTNKANKAADDSLVTSLNKALAIEEVDHDVDNMHDAVECLKREGYLTSTLVTKSDQKLLYSLEENRFLLEEDKNEGVYQGTPDYKFWTIQNSYDSSKQQYSIYAADNFNVAAVSGLKVGFDAGDCSSITSITYVGVGETQNVVIRTNKGTLTINAENDEVSHFGHVDYVDIIAVKSSSYEERGVSSLIKIAKGNISLNGDSNVGEIHLAKTNDAFDDIKVTLKDGAQLPDLSRDPVGTALANDVLICEIEKSGTSEFYWLSGNATIEDEKVLVSSNKAGTDKVAATAEDSTAVAIANAKTGQEVVDKGATIKPASEMTPEEVTEATASGATKTFAKIDSKEKLIEFRDAWNAGKLANGTFKLTANIDISDEEWLPIGNWQYPFNGIIDGQNHTINGMKKTTATEDDVYATGSTIGYGQVFGFVGIAGNGDVTIKSINFTNVDISLSAAGKNVGSVIGYAPSSAKFKAADDGNDWSDKWADNNSIGTNDITIDNVSTSGDLICKSHGGGIMGKMYSTGDLTITNTTNNVNVEAKGGNASGLCAIVSNLSVTITGCTNKGNIMGYDKTYASGIFNSSVAGSNNMIKNCVNEGNISNTNTSCYVAGVVAIGNGNNTVQNLENKGNVTGRCNYIGGVLSGTGNQTLTIDAGYLKNSGNVQGYKTAGGITGRLTNSLTVAENIQFINTGHISVTQVGSIEGNINQPYGAGAIFACIGTDLSIVNCSFTNEGQITAPEGSHTGLLAASITNITVNFNGCSYTNTGSIAVLESNAAPEDLPWTSHKYSIAFNTIEKQIFGFVPKDTGDVRFGETGNNNYSLLTDELNVVSFSKNDSRWDNNKIEVISGGFTYEISREQKEGTWYLYTIAKKVSE